jgi:IS30 family transposase
MPHLTKEDRDRIAQLFHRGANRREIAKALGFAPSTISRELARNSTGGEYLAAQAHERSQRRRRERPLQRKIDRPQLNEFVRHGLTHYWSPQQIAGRLKYEFPDDPQRHVSAQTIYDWIAHHPQQPHWRQFLRRRGCRRRRPASENAAQASRIDLRPAVVETRGRLGDFEGDTVLGPPGTGGLVTLVDRQSRLTLVSKIHHKEAEHVHDKIKQRLKPLGARRCRSITFDNGTEFARCGRLEKHLGIQLYFAQPGCPYQRGTNENTNGLLRQFFPKGTDFRDISYNEVRRVEELMNNRPRACLGYQTPNEIFHAASPQSCCD